MNLPLEKYNFVAKQMGSVVSLDAPVVGRTGKSRGDDNTVFMDLVQGGMNEKKEVTPDGLIMSSSLSDGVIKVVNSLPERQAFVVQHRFGLIDGHAKTLAEVG